MQICFMNEDVLDDDDANDPNDGHDDEESDDAPINEQSVEEPTVSDTCILCVVV